MTGALFLCADHDEAERLSLRGLDAIDGKPRATDFYVPFRARNVIVTPRGQTEAKGSAYILRSLSCEVAALPAGIDLENDDLLAAPCRPMFQPVPDSSDTSTRSQFDRVPLNWTELAGIAPPARDWAMDGWIGMGHATLLGGVGGIGKSLLSQEIGSALAIGLPFVGNVTRPRTVLAWYAEDDHDELWRRQIAIAAHLDVPLAGFAGKFIAESFVDRDCTLMDCGDFGGRLVATPMLKELRDQVGDYRADVVILDNVARIFGGKESDRGHVTRFVSNIVGSCNGAAVLLLAHPGRATGSEYSGSSAWEASVRTRLYLGDRPPDQAQDEEVDSNATTRYLARRKRNYAGPDLRTLQYRDGVLIPDEPTGGSWLVDGLRASKAERVVLDGLRKLLEMNQNPADGTTSPSFLPKLLLDYKLGEGMTKKELTEAMRRHMTDRRLLRAVVGTYANRAPRYGLREA